MRFLDLHRMSGSKAARRMFLLKRVRDPNIKTSELQRLGWMLDDAVERMRSGAVDPKVGGN